MSNSESSSISKGEYEVEAIVSDRKKKYYDQKLKKYKFSKEYLIKWKGYKRKTWEPEENLDNCKEILSSYIMEKKRKSKEVNTPNKFSINNNRNKSKINSPIKDKKSPYLNYSPDDEHNNENNENSRDEEYVCEDDKSRSSSNSKSKRKLRKRRKIDHSSTKKYPNSNNTAINNNTNNNANNNNAMNNNTINNKVTKAYENVDIDIIDGNESPFSNKTNMNTKNEFYSDSSFEPLNNMDHYSKFKKNLEKKRKRSSDTFSDISISIEDPIMKTENTSQNCTNANHIDFIGITQISIPKTEKESISILYKLKNNNKKVIIKGKSYNNNIPKEEIIKIYEKILINYLGGKTINIQ